MCFDIGEVVRFSLDFIFFCINFSEFGFVFVGRVEVVESRGSGFGRSVKCSLSVR